MKTREDLGTTKLRDFQIAALDDDAFIIYLQGRYVHGDLGSVFNHEIHFLAKNFFERVDNRKLKLINDIIAELNSLDFLAENRFEKDFFHLFRYLFTQIQAAETQEELNSYNDFFQAAIKNFNAQSTYKVPDNLIIALDELCDTSFARLETEKQHARGVWINVGKMVIGAATYLPVPSPVYTVIAWGEWARGIIATEMQHPLKIGERFQNAVKATVDFMKKIPTFVKNHWKALLMGAVVTAGLAATLGIVVFPLVAPVLATFTITTGLIMAGLAVTAISAAVYKYKEYAREKRIAKRLDDCQKEINNVLRTREEEPKPGLIQKIKNIFKPSNLLINEQLMAETMTVVIENVQVIAKQCMQELKHSEITNSKTLQKQISQIMKSLNKKNMTNEVLASQLFQMRKVLLTVIEQDVGLRQDRYTALLNTLIEESKPICSLEMKAEAIPPIVQTPDAFSRAEPVVSTRLDLDHKPDHPVAKPPFR